MTSHVTWKGSLNLSLVSLPVKAYSASGSADGPKLNQLHAGCNCRIKQPKTCPAHGPVTSDQIVMGYEYAKDQYAVVDLAGIDKLRPAGRSKAIQVEAFVPSALVQPIYYSDKHYYLLPDGPAGQRPYALLQQAMSDRGVQGLAQVVLARREQLVLLWPLERILCMTVLKYAAQVRSPAGFVEELTECEAAEEERALAATLVDQTTRRELDLARYRDEYAEKLTQVIDAAVHGKELVATPSDEPRAVLNLLDALKASVAQGASPPNKGGESGAAHKALAGQLARPRSGRKAAAKNGKVATQRTAKKPASRRRRKKSA